MKYEIKPILEVKAYNALALSLLLVLISGITWSGSYNVLNFEKVFFLFLDSCLILFTVKSFVRRKSLLDLVLVTLTAVVILGLVLHHIFS